MKDILAIVTPIWADALEEPTQYAFALARELGARLTVLITTIEPFHAAPPSQPDNMQGDDAPRQPPSLDDILERTAALIDRKRDAPMWRIRSSHRWKIRSHGAAYCTRPGARLDHLQRLRAARLSTSRPCRGGAVRLRAAGAADAASCTGIFRWDGDGRLGCNARSSARFARCHAVPLSGTTDCRRLGERR